MAAPHAAGVAALVIEANGRALTPDQVRTILERSADDLGKAGNDDYYGLGRVNALRAVLQP
jgi:subtilisin family serine protease